MWLHNDATGEEKLLVACRDADKMEDEICFIQNPQLSPDGQKVYFECSAWAVSGAIHVVDLKTGEERFVCDGNGLEVLQKGKYRGDLLTMKHKYYGPPDYGSYDHTFLVNAQGKELKEFQEDDDLDKFLAETGNK